MNLTLNSFNGNNINNGTAFKAKLIGDSAGSPGTAEVAYVNRPYYHPLPAYKTLNERHITIGGTILGTLSTNRDTLEKYLNVYDQSGYKTLLATDEVASQWYVEATVVAFAARNREWRATLAVKDPVWRKNTESSNTWSITATGQTRAITVGGNLPAYPKFEITPTSSKTSGNGFGFKRFVLIYNTTTRAFPNYPINVCGTTLDTAALVTASKMQADGDDLRVSVDGLETNRWLQGINTTTTKVWCNIGLKPKQETTLLTAIASTGSVTTIALKVTAANKVALTAMPAAGLVLIDSELFTYTAKDINKYQLTVGSRAAHGTSQAAHSAGATVRWIEHAIYTYYGNSSMTAPETDDNVKPIIDLTSTNTSWIYNEFWASVPRTAMWKPSVLFTLGKLSVTYTGDHAGEADPATEMGMSLNAWQRQDRWQGENATLVWALYHPAGITTVDSSGEKYRSATNWPANARLQKSNDGKTWVSVWNEATPGSVASWTSWTQASISLSGTYTNVRYLFAGVLAAIASNQDNFEVNTVTLTLNSSNVPSVTLGSEAGAYQLAARITNNATGDWIQVDFTLGTNEKLTVDCDAKTVTYSANGELYPGAVSFSSVRHDWLTMNPGSNTLQFDDAGTVAVTFVTKWRDRNT